MYASQVFFRCLSPPAMHLSTKAWASGASFSGAKATPTRPRQDFAWLIHLSMTFLMMVCFPPEEAEQDAHKLAERPPMSIAEWRSRPVRALTAAANFSCAFRFRFFVFSVIGITSTCSSFSYGVNSSVEGCKDEDGGGCKDEDGRGDCTTVSKLEKNFMMLIACKQRGG